MKQDWGQDYKTLTYQINFLNSIWDFSDSEEPAINNCQSKFQKQHMEAYWTEQVGKSSWRTCTWKRTEKLVEEKKKDINRRPMIASNTGEATLKTRPQHAVVWWDV